MTKLGYGGATGIRFQIRSTETTATILAGEAVEITGTTDISGAGDVVTEAGSLILEGRLNTSAKGISSVAENDIAPGQDGHVVCFGVTRIYVTATVAQGDALSADTVTRFKKATAAEIAAGDGVGKALAARTGAGQVLAFINLHHLIDDNSGYNGAETP